MGSHAGSLDAEQPIDAALAKLDPEVAYRAEVLRVGLITGTAAADFGTPLAKVGRTTGYTTGYTTEIRDQQIDVVGKGRVLFQDLIVAKKTRYHTYFGRAGDSGALVFSEHDRRAIGLYFAGDRYDSYGLIQPIGTILDHFKAALVNPQ